MTKQQLIPIASPRIFNKAYPFRLARFRKAIFKKFWNILKFNLFSAFCCPKPVRFTHKKSHPFYGAASSKHS